MPKKKNSKQPHSPPPTPNLLAGPITRHLFPLDLLPRDGQLPPQPLKLPLAQPAEPAIHLLLPPFLHPRDRPHDLARGRRHRRGRERLRGEETHVAVFVVVHVALQCPCQGGAGWLVEVGGAEATVPEVGGGVFVRDEEDGDGRGRGRSGGGDWGDDGVCGGGVVFLRVGGEGFG